MASSACIRSRFSSPRSLTITDIRSSTPKTQTSQKLQAVSRCLRNELCSFGMRRGPRISAGAFSSAEVSDPEDAWQNVRLLRRYFAVLLVLVHVLI